MKYLHYDLEDYLTDPQFINWVLHPDNENKIFWEEWLRSHPDHREKISHARHLLLNMHFHQLDPLDEDYHDVLTGILQGKKSRHAGRQTKMKPTISIQWQFFKKIAAVFLLIMLGTAAWLEFDYKEAVPPVKIDQVKYVVKKNPRGQRSIIELQDGSKVYLNAESEISYIDGFQETSREIKLKGEAYFEVASDPAKPFIVEAEGITTKAIGTSFNIKAYEENNNITISLTSGKVVVGNLWNGNKEEEQLILNPGDKASYTASNGLVKEKLDYNKDIAWKEGVLFFNNAEFEEVMQRLERWYDVKIIVSGKPLKDWHYDGSFKNASLERVMERLAYVQDFKFELKGKNLYVKLNEKEI